MLSLFLARQATRVKSIRSLIFYLRVSITH